MRYILIALLLISPGAVADWLKTIDNFSLPTVNNYTFTLNERSASYVAIYIQGNGCPIARLSYPEYTRVKEEFAGADIEFTMLNANTQDSVNRIIEEREQFKHEFDVIKDASQAIAKSLGVERTAEVFVIETATGEVKFRGPISDALGYETQRSATQHYLSTAISTILAGGTVDHDSIPDSKGCLIGFFL